LVPPFTWTTADEVITIDISFETKIWAIKNDGKQKVDIKIINLTISLIVNKYIT
jgi:hypothetical protein